MTGRNVYLDVIRGVAMLIVVLGHALQSANGMSPWLPAQQIIMTFWMPLFFLLAGYADGMTGGGSGLGKKVFRLLVPYFIWSQVVFLCGLCRGDMYTLTGHLDSVISSKFWFLRMLFFCWFSCYVYRKLWHRLENYGSFLRMLCAVGAALGVALLLGRESITHYLPCYVIGIAVFKSLPHVSIRLRWLFMIVGSVAFIGETVAFLHVRNVLMCRMLDLSMAFTGSLLICLVAKMMMWMSCIIPFLKFCGQQSLGIYAVHWCLLFNTDILRLHGLVVKGVDVHLVGLIGFVGWTLISVCLVWFFGRIDVLNCLLLGNKGRRARA